MAAYVGVHACVIQTALPTKKDEDFAVCLSLSGQVHGVDELCLPFPDGRKLPLDETAGYLQIFCYLVMKNCWQFNPEERPTFSLLGKQLEHFATRLTQNSIKFEYLTESTC